MNFSLPPFFPRLWRSFSAGFFYLFVFSLPATAQTWTYDFGTGTDVFTTPGSSTSFLPAPPRGTARVSIATDGSFSLVNPGSTLGSGSELQVLSSSTSLVNKFGIFGYPSGNTSYVKFALRFTRNGAGSWFFYLGSGATFSGDSEVDPTEAFTGLRWSFDRTGSITTSLHQSSGWLDLPAGSFAQNTDYIVEVYANNSDQQVSYDKNGVYSMQANTVDVWIDNVQVITGGQKLSLADLSGIDSWMFYGQSGNSTAQIILDDIQYANFIALKVLPVHFSQVKAATTTQGIEVQWENLTESNLAQYMVERSEDGLHFSPAGIVNPLRNDGSKAAYRFTDPAAAGVHYYRIRATEQSGKVFYSTVLHVSSGTTPGLTLYPNPVSDRKLVVEFSGLPKGSYSVALVNIAQKEVLRKTMQYNGGAHAETIELPVLPKGVYYLSVSDGSQRYYRPVIIR